MWAGSYAGILWCFSYTRICAQVGRETNGRSETPGRTEAPSDVEVLLRGLADGRDESEHAAHVMPQVVFGPYVSNCRQQLPHSALGGLTPREGPIKGSLEDPRLPDKKSMQ